MTYSMLLLSWCTVRLSRYLQKRVSKFEGRRSGSTSEHWDSCPATWNIVSVLKTTATPLSISHRNIKTLHHQGNISQKIPHQVSKSPMLGSRGTLEDSSFSPWDRRAYSKDSPNWKVNETRLETFQAKLKTEQQQRSDLVLTCQGQRIRRQIFEDLDQLTERQAANHISKGRVEHRKGLKDRQNMLQFWKLKFV